MRSMFRSLLILIVPLFTAIAQHINLPLVEGCTQSPPNCLTRRAIFDIGSGSTKLLYALVNHCEKKIENVIHQNFIPVPYQESLDASDNGTLDEKVTETGLQAIRTLLADCHKKQGPVDEAYGVATAAFRQAKNGHSVLKKFEEKTGVKVAIIDQEGEALLGHISVEREQADPLTPPVVWDIGGGSQQIIAKDATGRFISLSGAVATETFKKMLIEELHNHDSTLISTANPIGKENISDAFEIAHNILAFPARHTTTLYRYMEQAKHQVVGIGAVHDAIVKVIRNDSTTYTKVELMEAVQKYADYTDEQLMGVAHDTHRKFAGNLLSNIILVYAMMEAFHIDQVTVKSINASDALLLDGLESDYLKPRTIQPKAN